MWPKPCLICGALSHIFFTPYRQSDELHVQIADEIRRCDVSEGSTARIKPRRDEEGRGSRIEDCGLRIEDRLTRDDLILDPQSSILILYQRIGSLSEEQIWRNKDVRPFVFSQRAEQNDPESSVRSGLSIRGGFWTERVGPN